MAEEMQQQAIQTTTEAMAANTVEKDVRNSLSLSLSSCPLASERG